MLGTDFRECEKEISDFSESIALRIQVLRSISSSRAYHGILPKPDLNTRSPIQRWIKLLRNCTTLHYKSSACFSRLHPLRWIRVLHFQVSYNNFQELFIGYSGARRKLLAIQYKSRADTAILTWSCYVVWCSQRSW